jgi:hypothetical protein
MWIGRIGYHEAPNLQNEIKPSIPTFVNLADEIILKKMHMMFFQIFGFCLEEHITLHASGGKHPISVDRSSLHNRQGEGLAHVGWNATRIFSPVLPSHHDPPADNH